MWRPISRRVSTVAGVALVVLVGCGGGTQATSAGTVATAPTTAAAVPAATTTVAQPTTTTPRCADVGFSANSDDVASEIKATGLSCADAEALVRKVGPQVSAVGGPSPVSADGFVCTRTSAHSGDHGPPSSTFECISGTTKVAFVRT
jgi:hypothetical protein